MYTKGDIMVTKEGLLKGYDKLWDKNEPAGKRSVTINELSTKWASMEAKNPLDPECKMALMRDGHVKMNVTKLQSDIAGKLASFKECQMSTVAIVHHSGFGHTKSQAEAGRADAESVADISTSFLTIDVEGNLFAIAWDEVLIADAIIFGSPTYLGAVSWQFKKLADAFGLDAQRRAITR